jgi:hypothetical protein
VTRVYVRVYWGWYFGHLVLKANLSGIKNLKAKVTHLKKKKKKKKKKKGKEKETKVNFSR